PAARASIRTPEPAYSRRGSRYEAARQKPSSQPTVIPAADDSAARRCFPQSQFAATSQTAYNPVVRRTSPPTSVCPERSSSAVTPATPSVFHPQGRSAVRNAISNDQGSQQTGAMTG